ncbi:hypothetical protein QAD02_022121, partial [Eretmocerus hayati]
MGASLRILAVLLYKNFLVLRGQWKSTIFKAFLGPVVLIVVGWMTMFGSLLVTSSNGNDTKYPPQPAVDPPIFFQDDVNVYFAPNNDFAMEVMSKSSRCLGVNKRNYRSFSTEEELINSMSETIDEDKIVLIFDEAMDKSKNKLHYKIRSRHVNDLEPFDNQFNIERYYASDAFTKIQSCVDMSFIQMKMNSTIQEPKIFYQKMPEPSRVEQKEVDNTMLRLFCWMVAVGLMIPVLSLVSDAANEKFLGINVLMSMNGVSNALSLLSWLFAGLIYITLFCTLPLMVGLFISKIYANHKDMIFFMHRSNMFLFWTAFTIHIAHSLAFGLHVSAYFSSSLFVTLGLLVINFGSLIMQQIILKNDSHSLVPYLGVLFPDLLLSRVVEEMTLYESLGQGIHCSNIFQVQKSSYKVGGSFGMVMVLSTIGILTHILLTIYIYEIHPGKYGVGKPAFFFLKRKSRSGSERVIEDPKFNAIDTGDLFEPVARGTYEPGIQMRNLRKIYKGSLFNQSEVHALRGVSVDFYKGQITALLGHNGAGKTTMMSILSGMTSPSHGVVFINSKDVSNDTHKILRDMGLCTQENMVFPNLSVYQQLLIFSMLKNNNNSKSSNEHGVQLLLQSLRLFEKRHCMANKLSGGQKRRLCLSMALVGEGNVIILDEPTSGLDPENRRLIWDVILKMRENRTILISTHDMEEADILGDRIAIMHAGQLRSYGTPMFLKRIVGHGNVEVTLSTEPWCDMNNVCNELNNQMRVVNESSGKMVVCVPNTSDLPDSLDRLESKKTLLGVSGLSVSLISLEQVFLRVTQDKDGSSKVSQNLPMVTTNSPRPSFLQQFHGLLIKKAIYCRKNVSMFVVMMLLTFLAIFFIYFHMEALILSEREGKNFSINLDIYSDSQIFYQSQDVNLGQKYEQTVNELGSTAKKIQGTSLDDDLMEIGRKDINSYHRYVIAAANFTKTTEGAISGIALYSSSASFSWPISLNLLTNAILKSLAGDDYSISLTSHQLPYRSAAYVDEVPVALAWMISTLLMFLLYIMVALIVIHPVLENSANVKQLQRMTGASGLTYWGSMMAFDMVTLLLVMTLIIAAFVGFDISFGLHMFGLYET